MLRTSHYSEHKSCSQNNRIHFCFLDVSNFWQWDEKCLKTSRKKNIYIYSVIPATCFLLRMEIMGFAK